MKATGVKMTADELAIVTDAAKRAREAPVMGYGATNLETMADRARADMNALVTKLALAHGLPDLDFFWGVKLDTGEFIVPGGFEDRWMGGTMLEEPAKPAPPPEPLQLTSQDIQAWAELEPTKRLLGFLRERVQSLKWHRDEAIRYATEKLLYAQDEAVRNGHLAARHEALRDELQCIVDGIESKPEPPAWLRWPARD